MYSVRRKIKHGAFMTRRYLTLSEAEAALSHGKSIECFIGPCSREGKAGIRWLSAIGTASGVSIQLYESADLGDEDFTDVYEFGPLDPELEFEEAAETIEAPSFSVFVSILHERFPGASSRMVNPQLVQDEYADFIARRRK
jgi:hypothetical protein